MNTDDQSQPKLSRLDKLIRMLQGEPPQASAGDTALATLYRSTARGLRTTIPKWKEGIDALVNLQQENGELTAEQGNHKRGYLTPALSNDTISWKVFMDGIRVLIMCNRKSILRIRFQIVVDRKLRNGDVEAMTHSVTVHDETKRK